MSRSNSMLRELEFERRRRRAAARDRAQRDDYSFSPPSSSLSTTKRICDEDASLALAYELERRDRYEFNARGEAAGRTLAERLDAEYHGAAAYPFDGNDPPPQGQTSTGPWPWNAGLARSEVSSSGEQEYYKIVVFVGLCGKGGRRLAKKSLGHITLLYWQTDMLGKVLTATHLELINAAVERFHRFRSEDWANVSRFPIQFPAADTETSFLFDPGARPPVDPDPTTSPLARLIAELSNIPVFGSENQMIPYMSTGGSTLDGLHVTGGVSKTKCPYRVVSEDAGLRHRHPGSWAREVGRRAFELPMTVYVSATKAPLPCNEALFRYVERTFSRADAARIAGADSRIENYQQAKSVKGIGERTAQKIKPFFEQRGSGGEEKEGVGVRLGGAGAR